MEDYHSNYPKDHNNKVEYSKIEQNSHNNISKNISTQENSLIPETDNERMKIIGRISDLFLELCDDNKNDINSISKNTLIKPFLSKQIPSISIKDYLIRLYKYSKINNSTIILILIYIDKICNLNKFKLSYYNIHKLILASMLISIKYNEDEYYSLNFYAKMGGVSINELSNLEYQFLVLINFDLFVDEALFIRYNDYISSSDSSEEEDEDEDENKNETNG